MTEADFNLLASRVLGGEASAEERAQWDALIAADPEARVRFMDLQAAWESVRQLGLAADAVGAAEPPIPAQRLEALSAALRPPSGVAAPAPEPRAGELFPWRALLPARRWALLLPALLVTLGVGWLLFRRDAASPGPPGGQPPAAYLLIERGPVEIARGAKTFPGLNGAMLIGGDVLKLKAGAEAALLTVAGLDRRAGPAEVPVISRAADAIDGRPPAGSRLDLALFGRVAVLEPGRLLLTTRSGNGIGIYSPRGATASLQPIVLWNAEPERTYSVEIRDELDLSTPPWRLPGAVPPVRFAGVKEWRERALSPGGLYRIIIADTGNPASATEHTFTVLDPVSEENPVTSRERLVHAHRMLTNEPPCPGDALVQLLALPPEAGASPLALRLKLLAFGQLGLAEEFLAVSASIRSTP